MDFRLIAVSIAIGWACVIGLALFAHAPAHQPSTQIEYEKAVAALRKSPGGGEELVAKCVRLTVPEIQDAALQETSYSDRTAMAKDICRRIIKVMLDGRFTFADFNRLAISEVLKLIEEAERRQPRFRDG